MKRNVAFALFVLLCVAILASCGGSDNKVSTPPPSVSVTVTPATVDVETGQTKQFTATVTGSTNTAVTWSVVGGAANGSITSAGLYTGPATVPNPATVTITATSLADSTKSATATVTVKAPVAVTVSPTQATVETGKTQQFAATVTGSTNTAVTWSVVGGAANGTITSAGLYTAPATVPTPAAVTITATSQADTTKSATAAVTIKAPVSVAISPTQAFVVISGTQQFAATVTGSTDTSVTWTVVGGAANGTITSAGLYTAPATVPTPATVTVKATSNADNTKSASASVTITATPVVTVTVSPKSAKVALGASQQFTANVANGMAGTVTWKVNDVVGGDSTNGTITADGLYTAPKNMPQPTKQGEAQANTDVTVTITAVSNDDSTKVDTATVTLTAPISIAISPKTADVVVSTTRQFTANVQGITDTVDWTLSGTGCTGAQCGWVDSTGLYTAPATVPGSTVTVKAALHSDATKFDTAVVTVKDVTAASKLNGKFAFVFSGYQGTTPLLRVGSFTADGNGNITAGRHTVDGPGHGLYDLTGTYTVGSDNRGVMTLTETPGSKTVKYRFVLKADGSGRFTEWDDDTTSTHGNGQFKQQVASMAYDQIQGGYAFQLAGVDENGTRFGMLGQFTAAGTLNTANPGVVDYVAAAGLEQSGNLTVNVGSASIESFGRIGLTITTSGRSITCEAYMMSPDEGFVISRDDVTNFHLIGRIVKQVGAGAYTKASLSGNLIGIVDGYDLDPGDRTKTALTQLTMDGNGSLTGFIDQNDINDPQPYQTFPMTGTYTVSANGRVDGSFSIGPQAVPLVFYLYGPNKGFLMDGNRGQAFVKDVNMGMFEPQSAGPFSSISGTFTIGSDDMPSKDVRIPVGFLTFDASGSYTGKVDFDLGTLYPDQSVTGSYTFTNTATGRATMSVTLPDSTHPLVLYSVSPSKMYGISINPNDGNGTIIIFEK